MSLSQPRAIFGVHSITPFSRTTGEPYGTAKVIGEASIGLSGELIKLMGGSNKYPWAVEDGAINAEISLKIREYPNFLFELFLGKAPTTAGVDTAGTTSALTDKFGTSVVDATTGIASVSVLTASKANLKFGRYLVKAASSTTIDIYALSDIDFARGTDATFVNDTLKITSSALTITSGSNTDVAAFGLRFTGGSGTIGMTAGDTATFEVLPPSDSSADVKVGGSADTYPEFSLLLVAQKQGSGHMTEIEVFRAKGIGAPIGFTEKAFSEAEIKVEAFYDSVQDGVFRMRDLYPTTAQ